MSRMNHGGWIFVTIAVVLVVCICTIACVTMRVLLPPPAFFADCKDRDYTDRRFCHIPCANVKDELVRMYRSFLRLCESSGVTPILQAGGLIGWSFNERVLPWDGDLDLFIPWEQVPNIVKLNGHRSDDMMIEINPNYLVREAADDPNNIIDGRVISMRCGVFIDLNFLHRCPIDATYVRGKPVQDRFLGRNIFPPQRARFEGLNVWVPARPTEYLIERYGERVREPAYAGWVFDGAEWRDTR